MPDLHGITNGIDVEVAGEHSLIYLDGPCYPCFKTRLFCQGKLGADTDGKDNEIMLDCCSTGERGRNPCFRVFKGCHPIPQNELDPVKKEILLRDGCHLVVHGDRHDLGKHLHDGNLKPPFPEVLGSLKADVSTTHHQRPGRPALLDESYDGVHVGDGLQREDPRIIHQAWNRWHEGVGTW